MTNSELNKWLWINVLEECWHETRELTFDEREPIYGFFGGVKDFKNPSLARECIKCGASVSPMLHNGIPLVIQSAPFYCSDLNAIAELESEILGYTSDSSAYEKAIGDYLNERDGGWAGTLEILHLSARERAEIAKKVWETK